MPDREHKLRGSDPRLNEPRRRGDTRVLDLKSGLWQWKVATDKVIIYSPENKRHEVPMHEIFGMTAEELRKHHDDWTDYDSTSTIPVTPKDISDYINEKILGRNLVKAA